VEQMTSIGQASKKIEHKETNRKSVRYEKEPRSAKVRWSGNENEMAEATPSLAFKHNTNKMWR